jgi:hypothetical protein
MKKTLFLFSCIISLQAFSQCYSVTQIVYAPDSFNAGTAVPIADDQFSPMIQMPFSFCFFGNVYNRLTIASNGYISFDTTHANSYCQWPIGAAIPSSVDPLNAIFITWQDLAYDPAAHFFYAVYGSAPNRRFVVSIYQAPMYSGSCTQLTYTGEVMLYETTNVIEMHIQHKDLCASWNGGNAIEGIQNISGTQAAVVPGRNYPSQWTTNNDAWLFSPNCCPLGIHPVEKTSLLSIYPNPSSDNLHIHYTGNTGKFYVEMTDPAGRLIYRDNLSAEQERTLSVAGIAAGIYFIRIVSEDGSTIEIRRQEIR